MPMVSHVPQAQCRRRSASQSVIAQSLIWASMMIGNAIVLRGTPAADRVMLILLMGAAASVVLTAAACRRTRAEADGDFESRH